MQQKHEKLHEKLLCNAKSEYRTGLYLGSNLRKQSVFNLL